MNRTKIFLTTLFLMVFFGLASQNFTRAESSNLRLEKDIQDSFDEARRKKRINHNDRGHFLITDLDKAKVLVDMNSHKEITAASLIKPFIMYAYYVSDVKYLGDDIRKMIADSNNNATNKVIKKMGGLKKVNALIRRKFPNTKLVEYIPNGGATYKNKTTIKDLAKLFEMVHKRSFKGSKAMFNHFNHYTTTRFKKTRRAQGCKRKAEPCIQNMAGKTGYVYGANGECALIQYKNKGTKNYLWCSAFSNTDRHSEKKRTQSWKNNTSKVLQNAFKKTLKHF